MQRRQTRQSSRATGEGELLLRLEEALGLADQGQVGEAFAIATGVEETDAQGLDVLGALLNVYSALRCENDVGRVAERLYAMAPDIPLVVLKLGAAHLSQQRLVHATRWFEQFLRKFPRHEEASYVRSSLGTVRRARKFMRQAGYPPQDVDDDLIYDHEEVSWLMVKREFSQARHRVEQILARQEFLPALDSLGQLAWRNGEIGTAISCARRTLEVRPDDLRALSSLAHYLFVTGDAEEARTLAARLDAQREPCLDNFARVANLLGLLGHDDELFPLYGQALASESPVLLKDGLLPHFAAVAASRKGQEALAQALWEEALAWTPRLDIARHNLADLARPAHERNGGWSHDGPLLLPGNVAEEVGTIARGDLDDEERDAASAALLERHPWLGALIPWMFERGDEALRRLAISLSPHVQRPDVRDALQTFTLGQRGSDSVRLSAAQQADQMDVLEARPVRLWIKGQYIETFGCRLDNEPSCQHSPEVSTLLDTGVLALRKGRYAEAEKAFREARRLDPAAPDIKHNLAAALLKSGREAESWSLIEEVNRARPTYVYAATALANRAATAGHLEEARRQLAPLNTLKRMHFREWAALAQSRTTLSLLEGDVQAARAHLDSWAEAVPGHPDLPQWRQLVEGAEAEALRQFPNAAG